MAKIEQNNKGFKILSVTGREMLQIGCGNICDNCAQTSENGYYVAVLNRWFCPVCFANWYDYANNEATPFNADGRIEEKNFTNMKIWLGINDEET